MRPQITALINVERSSFAKIIDEHSLVIDELYRPIAKETSDTSIASLSNGPLPINATFDPFTYKPHASSSLSSGSALASTFKVSVISLN